MTLEHGMADVEPGVRFHYVTAGTGSQTAILLHGFPKTWWEWRGVIPRLVEAGYALWRRTIEVPDTPRVLQAAMTNGRFRETSGASCDNTSAWRDRSFWLATTSG